MTNDNLDMGASLLICLSGALGLAFATYYYFVTKAIEINPHGSSTKERLLLNPDGLTEDAAEKVAKITHYIALGAKSFLYQEYKYLSWFVVAFALVILFALGPTNKDAAPWSSAALTATAFIIGGITSIISGYIGMSVAVIANGRTAIKAVDGYPEAFRTAYRAGAVMGFALCSLALLVLFVTINLFKLYFKNDEAGTIELYEAIAGYGLGGSSIALFGRVGGGIYTKAADVGADLVGKVEQGIPEDDPRNPAVVADNVGDNVGDIAGMGADLFGSFAEATCAAMVVASTSPELRAAGWHAMMFPLSISAGGILVSFVTSFFATHLDSVTKKEQIEPMLKRQLLVSTILMSPVLAGLAMGFLPKTFSFPGSVTPTTKNWQVFLCALSGLWSGLATGYITEYFTSHSNYPVRELANSCRTGAATNIIYGLALGYRSVIIPVMCLTFTVWLSFTLAGMYGIAVAALGILSTLAIGLTIDAYGPISDNAGGIAEMSGLGPEVRERTDALDAAGNTTAAIGKGFAIGSAALVSLALFGGFVTRSGIEAVNLMEPFPFSGLLIGAMLPYAFSSMTMKSVGKAALAMVEEVRRQFREIEGLMEGKAEPDYERCVQISTDASLKEMVWPGILVLGTPLFVGFCFGKDALAGMLAGSLVSGVQMAISCANTGGAWDNAKKYIEGGELGGKGSDCHKAAVVGDTVGDPLKDTSGPSLNILVKLMAVESLVFANFIANWSEHGGLVQTIYYKVTN